MEGKKEQEVGFYKAKNLKDRILFCLRYAVLAPSVHNIQPWKFEVREQSCVIHFDINHRLKAADPHNYYAYMALGAALENLVLSSRYFGIFKGVILHEDNGGKIEVLFADGIKDENYRKYLNLIENRYNYRGPFLNKKIDYSIFDELGSIYNNQYKRNGLEYFWLTEPAKINRIANLTKSGVEQAHNDPVFRKEMGKHLHNNLSWKRDGMPGYSLRMPFFLSFILPLIIPVLNLGKLLGKLNFKSINSAPAVCVMCTTSRSFSDFVNMGRYMQRMFLEFNSRGIKTSVFVASVEIGDLYKEVQNIVGCQSIPRFVFCAGYPALADQKLTPKHTVTDKLIGDKI